jgi:hypothetical protein
MEVRMLLKFSPMLASHAFLLELSDGLWGDNLDEITPEAHVHAGDYAITGYDGYALAGSWDLYLVSSVEANA